VPLLSFAIEGARAIDHAAAPMIALHLRVTNAPAAERVHTIVLRAQIQIEAPLRRYDADEQRDLADLFGAPDRWSTTVKSLLWTHASVAVPAFEASALVDLPVPCTYDLTVAAAKYFHALKDGEVPLRVFFSGTVFYEGAGGALQVAQIPWSNEAAYRLPIRVWRAMMDAYYPSTRTLALHRDVFDRLHRFKVARGLPTWEQTIAALLPSDGAEPDR
jgi:hypothetical protein